MERADFPPTWAFARPQAERDPRLGCKPVSVADAGRLEQMARGKSEVMCDQGQLYKVSKSKVEIVNKEKLTKHRTDWVDYWAVDFDYMQCKEIIKVPRESGVGENAFENQPSIAVAGEIQFEERWTGGYIFENEWQSFRTRQNRALDLTAAQHT